MRVNSAHGHFWVAKLLKIPHIRKNLMNFNVTLLIHIAEL